MSWFYLIVAGLLEIGWAVGLKYTHGFSRPVPTVAVAVSMVASLYFLSLSLKQLPLGTAYAIWTGIGAVGTAVTVTIITADTRPNGYPVEQGYVWGFVFLAVMSLVAALTATLIPGSRRGAALGAASGPASGPASAAMGVEEEVLAIEAPTAHRP